MWRNPVARFVRDEEVVGSNPATPTAQRGHHPARRMVAFNAIGKQDLGGAGAPGPSDGSTRSKPDVNSWPHSQPPSRVM